MKLSNIVSVLNRGAARVVASILGLLGSGVALSSGSLLGLLLVFLGPTIVIAIHEYGHAWAAWRFGMVVREIAIGPAAIKFHPTRIGFAEKFLGKDVGGHVFYEESARHFLSRRSENAICAAGPGANLISGLVFFGLAQLAGQTFIAQLLGALFFMSMAAFVISAWPFTTRDGVRNDARQIVSNWRSARPSKPKRKDGRSPWQAP